MKKFFKILGLVIVLCVLASWIIPTGNYTNGQFVVGNINRVGIFDLGQYLLLGIYYFAIIITFLLVLGGFYSVVAKIPGYQKLVTDIAKKIKGKEIAFVLVTSFVFAALTSISTELYQLLIFVPFLITIMSKLKLEKTTAFCATFGGILVGIVGSTFSPVIFEYINHFLGVKYTTEIFAKIVLFVAAYGLFNFFTIKHMKKVKNNSKREMIEDKFAVEEVKSTKKSKKEEKNTKYTGLIVVGVILLLLQIMAYIGWKDVFEISAFTKFHTWITGLSIGDAKVLSYILGTVNAFGSWDLYAIQTVLLIAIIVLKIVYKIPAFDCFENFLNGCKKMCRPIIIVILAYTVCVLTTVYPVIPTITDWLMSLTKSFNVYLASIATVIASLFSVEMRYAVSSIGQYMAGQFGSEANNPTIMLVFQSFYGLVQFFAPTSAILVLGLSYLGIDYKSWLKYIWKFLVALLIVILIVISIVAFA